MPRASSWAMKSPKRLVWIASDKERLTDSPIGAICTAIAVAEESPDHGRPSRR